MFCKLHFAKLLVSLFLSIINVFINFPNFINFLNFYNFINFLAQR